MGNHDVERMTKIYRFAKNQHFIND